jgi:hypothetical protein
MLIFTVGVHCLHSAMFFRTLGLQLGPAVSIEISLLNVASVNFRLEVSQRNFRYYYRRCNESYQEYNHIRGGNSKESMVLRIAVCKHPLLSTEIILAKITSASTIVMITHSAV